MAPGRGTLGLLVGMGLCAGGHAERVKEYFWLVEQTVAAPDGYPRSVIAVRDHRHLDITPKESGANKYNDRLIYHQEQQIPGPELRVRQGDRVIVHVTNMLMTTAISVHWHGLHMKDQAWMDGTAGVTGCAIPPDGGKGMYNFTVDQPPGTHWWHSHVGTQFADGLYGAIIIEPANGALTPVQEDVPYTDDQARVRLRAVAS